MHLTATFALHANTHDQALLTTALARWNRAYGRVLDRARAREAALLRDCLTHRVGKDGKGRLQVNGRALHAAVLDLVAPVPIPLHSSARMSMVVEVEKTLGSWLALYAEWATNRDEIARKRAAGKSLSTVLVKPRFPRSPENDVPKETVRAEVALDAFAAAITLPEEIRARDELLTERRQRYVPMYFGAATSGAERAQVHMGFIRRQDGRLFALLTLFPTGDRRGSPVTRARNRKERGTLVNLRSEKPFNPTKHARCSIMVPLEYADGARSGRRGHERLFLERAAPKSAHLVQRGEKFFLHAAFEYPEHPARPMTGAVLAIRRGVTTLLAAVVMDAKGQEIARMSLDGRVLAAEVTNVLRERALAQAAGRSTRGDRRLTVKAEDTLYSAAHQVVDLACRHGAEVVLLEDPRARWPQPLLAWKHFARLAEYLGYLCPEAGLPASEVRPIYGSWATCPRCGWHPGERVKEMPRDAACGRCDAPREHEWFLPTLLALDTLRWRARKAEQDNLPGFIARLRGFPATGG